MIDDWRAKNALFLFLIRDHFRTTRRGKFVAPLTRAASFFEGGLNFWASCHRWCFEKMTEEGWERRWEDFFDWCQRSSDEEKAESCDNCWVRWIFPDFALFRPSEEFNPGGNQSSTSKLSRTQVFHSKSFQIVKVFRGKLKWQIFRGPSSAYVWVHSQSNMPMFCLKEIIPQPWVDFLLKLGFSQIGFFTKYGFLMHPNGTKCLRNE